MLSVVILRIVLRIVVMLTVTMLSVVMLSVVAPFQACGLTKQFFECPKSCSIKPFVVSMYPGANVIKLLKPFVVSMYPGANIIKDVLTQRDLVSK